MDFFVARLMSLNEHELRCLRSDHELQSHLQRTHLLMESKLQQYSNASSIGQLADSYALDLRLQDQNQQLQLTDRSRQQLHQLHQLQQQLYHHHHHQQQQQHQQQQLQLQHHQRLHQQQQQHQHQHQQLQLQPQQQHQYHHQQQQEQEKCFNPKKRKCFEWTSNGSADELYSPTPPASSASTASTTLARDDQVGSPPATTINTNTNSSITPLSTPTPTAAAAAAAATTTTTTTTTNNHLSQVGALTITPVQLQLQPASNTGGGKKYKGEFDEPNALEVELRLKLLMLEDNYHSKNSPRGECACILGSEFRDKSASSVLMMVEQWRQMPTEQRVTFKWDMNDLPKDIPLSDIKRFENLRREASSGRADFGGASKRKPLGIRGTRQFLLILYCLWGHPGREDPMQREGYCPHCFAKIKKPNEQSTLVRVVNHFNMKHRRGANPRT